MASTSIPKHWFPAKRYGWGWGLPSVWQGWVVLITYLTLVLAGVPFVHASSGSFVYAIYVVVLTLALVVTCWLTGELRRWSWGGRDA
jgi:hypothetical protein